MDVRNSLKFSISTGNGYCQYNLDSKKKDEYNKKKKKKAEGSSMIDEYGGGARETAAKTHPP